MFRASLSPIKKILVHVFDNIRQIWASLNYTHLRNHYALEVYNLRQGIVSQFTSLAGNTIFK